MDGVELRKLFGRARDGRTREEAAAGHDHSRRSGGAVVGGARRSVRCGGGVVGGRVGGRSRRSTSDYLPVHGLASYVADWANNEAARVRRDRERGGKGGDVAASTDVSGGGAVVDGGPGGGGGPSELSGSPSGGDQADGGATASVGVDTRIARRLEDLSPAE